MSLLTVAFDLSLGLNGIVYPVLHEHVGVFKGLRAPAWASIFFLMFLAALAARGCAVVLKPPMARLYDGWAAATCSSSVRDEDDHR